MFSKGKNTITLDEILNKVSEFQILTYYFNITQLPCVINSPLRVDRNPSFGLFVNEKGAVNYKDFKTKEFGGLFNLLMQYWKLDFQDTLAKIYEDLSKFQNSNADREFKIKTGSRKKSKHVYSSTTDLQCKTRDWKQFDLDFWAKYGISKAWLDFGKIYPITHLIITKNKKTFIIPADKYAYAYIELKDQIPSIKVYQPYSSTHKWLNKHDASVWDLWEQLPESGEILIITSSRKDALCLWENTGIPSCSLQAESYIPKKHVVQQLKDRFKKIFVLYDNDFDKEENYGRELGKEIAQEFDLIQIEIPEKYKSKDPSDLFKNHNKKTLIEVIDNLTQTKFIN